MVVLPQKQGLVRGQERKIKNADPEMQKQYTRGLCDGLY